MGFLKTYSLLLKSAFVNSQDSQEWMECCEIGYWSTSEGERDRKDRTIHGMVFSKVLFYQGCNYSV